MSNLWFFRLKRAEQQRRRSSGEQSAGGASVQSAASLPATNLASELAVGESAAANCRPDAASWAPEVSSNGAGGLESGVGAYLASELDQRPGDGCCELLDDNGADRQVLVSRANVIYGAAGGRSASSASSATSSASAAFATPVSTTTTTTATVPPRHQTNSSSSSPSPHNTTNRRLVSLSDGLVMMDDYEPNVRQRAALHASQQPSEHRKSAAGSSGGGVGGQARHRRQQQQNQQATNNSRQHQVHQVPQVTIIRSDSTSSFIPMPGMLQMPCQEDDDYSNSNFNDSNNNNNNYQDNDNSHTSTTCNSNNHFRKQHWVSELNEASGLIECRRVSLGEHSDASAANAPPAPTLVSKHAANGDNPNVNRDDQTRFDLGQQQQQQHNSSQSANANWLLSTDANDDKQAGASPKAVQSRSLLSPNGSGGGCAGAHLGLGITADSMDNLAALIPRVRVEFYNSENTLKEQLQLYFIKDHTLSLYFRSAKLILKVLACYLYVFRVIFDRGPNFAACYGCSPYHNVARSNGTSAAAAAATTTDNLSYTTPTLIHQPQHQQQTTQIQTQSLSKFDNPYDGPINFQALFWVDRGPELWALQTTIAVICLSEAILMQYLTYKNSIFSLISFHFVLELVTSLPLIFSIFWIELRTLFVPTFLNCWLAKRCLEAMLNNLSIVRQTSVFSHRLTILSATVFCLIFTSACGFQHTQRCGGRGNPITIFESIYFVVVTFSTVGFGDFKPETWPAQLFIMVMICAALIVLPTQFDQLGNYWFERKKLGASYARHSNSNGKHVVVCSTTLRADTIMDFLNEFYAHPLLQTFSVVLLSPCELDTTMKLVLQTPTWNNRVVYIQGSALKAHDLIRARMQSAEACFILAARNYSDRSAADEHTILRSWAIRDFSPYVPQYVQIFRTENKIHVAFAEHVVCDDEFKYALLANNCLIPGTSTLVTLLLHTSQQQARRRRGRPAIGRYLRRLIARRRRQRSADAAAAAQACKIAAAASSNAYLIHTSHQACDDNNDNDKSAGAFGASLGGGGGMFHDNMMKNNLDNDDMNEHCHDDSNDDDDDDDDETGGQNVPEWKRLYGKCSANEIYHIRLSDSRFFGEYQGKSFTYASFHSHRKYGVALIGVQTDMRGTWPIMLNPGPSYVLKSGDILFYINITKEENSALMPMMHQQQQQQHRHQFRQHHDHEVKSSPFEHDDNEQQFYNSGNINDNTNADRHQCHKNSDDPNNKASDQLQHLSEPTLLIHGRLGATSGSDDATGADQNEPHQQQSATYIRIEASSPTACGRDSATASSAPADSQDYDGGGGGAGSGRDTSTGPQVSAADHESPETPGDGGQLQPGGLEANTMSLHRVRQHSVADGASILARSLCSVIGIPGADMPIATVVYDDDIDDLDDDQDANGLRRRNSTDVQGHGRSATGEHATNKRDYHHHLTTKSLSTKRNSSASTNAASRAAVAATSGGGKGTGSGAQAGGGLSSRNVSTFELAAIATGLRKGSNMSIASTKSRDTSPTRLKQVVNGLAVKMKRVKLGKSLTHLTIPRMDLGGGSSASSTESFVNARGRRPSIAPVPAMMGESEDHDSDHEREQESYFAMSWQSSSESSPIVKKFVFCTTYVGVSPTLCYLLQRKKPSCCLQLIQACEHCPFKNARQYNWPNKCIILASDFASNGIYNFLVPLRAHFHNPNELRPIVLLLERKPSPQFIDAISWFPMVYWMPGSIDNLDDLIKAGINLAHSVVVTNKESTNSAEEDYLADCNTIVAVQTMFKMFPSIGIITELSQSSNMRFMQFRAHDLLFGGQQMANYYSQQRQQQHLQQLQQQAQQRQDGSLDATTGAGTGAGGSQSGGCLGGDSMSNLIRDRIHLRKLHSQFYSEKMEGKDVNSHAYKYRLPFAAGNVFSASMLDTLLYQAFVKDYMITMVRLLLGIDQAPGSGFLSSIKITKDELWIRTYGRLYQRLCSTTCEIPLGIYRTEPLETTKQRRESFSFGAFTSQQASYEQATEELERIEISNMVKNRLQDLGMLVSDYDDSTNNRNNTFSYVIINPNCDIKLREGDIIYLIRPSPIHSRKLFMHRANSVRHVNQQQQHPTGGGH